MKIKLLHFVLSFAIFGIAHSQSPSFLWAKAAGGTNYDEGQSIATDADGNVFVTGSFQSPTITFGNTTLSNAGGFDTFIVKYEPSGEVEWAIGAGGANDDVGQSIATDADGNIFLTGYFYSPSITFEATTLLNSSVADDLFVVKYDPSGNLLWAKSEGGTGYEDGKGIATDASGNAYVTGNFSSNSISFGNTTLTNTTAPAGELFIVKYDSNGDVLWAKLGGQSPLSEKVNSIATDSDGNAYITGYFYHSSVWFGTFNLTKTSETESDLFVVKYDTNGNELWAKREGGTADDMGRSIATDLNGNVFITGYFKSPELTLGTTTLLNVGTAVSSLNLYVAKYDTNGNALWAKGAGNEHSEIANSVATDANGNAYVTGSFNSSEVSFGSNEITKAGSTYYSDIFVVKYDPDGNDLWAIGQGGTDTERAFGIVTDANENVCFTGNFFSPTIEFGTTTLTNSAGSFFVAKLSDPAIGIEELASTTTINIYPNPFSSSTTVQSSIHLNGATLRVYDSLGQLIKEVKGVSGRTFELAFDNISDGNYTLQLIEGKRTSVHRLLKISN